MSQFFQGVTAGSLPPSVPTSFETDINSPAVPAGNQLDVFGNSVTDDNLKGIQTDGSSGGDTLTIELTNRYSGTLITNDNTLTTICSCPMTYGSVYTFTGIIVGYNTTDNISLSVSFVCSCRTIDSLTNPVLLSDFQFLVQEDTPQATQVTVTASKTGFTFFQVAGLVGKTYSWKCVGTFIKTP